MLELKRCLWILDTFENMMGGERRENVTRSHPPDETLISELTGDAANKVAGVCLGQ